MVEVSQIAEVIQYDGNRKVESMKGGAMAIPVAFSIDVKVKTSADTLFRALIDWEDHASWIPLTKVTITKVASRFNGEAHVGQEFSARTGINPLAFDDNMRVTQLDRVSYSCEVEKIGPLLTGKAGFTLSPKTGYTVLTWYEDVVVPLPRFLSPILSPILGVIGSIAFRASFKKLATHIKRTAD